MGKLSSRKRSNKKKVDRISELSDHLLCRILAFLPTKSAMATSVLCRRWEYVWPGIPALNFTVDYESIDGEQQYRSWKRFLNRVLLHNRELCLERVDLDVHALTREEDLQEWYMVLSRRSVKEVNLFYDQRRDLSLIYLLDGTCGEHLVKLNIECRNDEDIMICPKTPMLRFERLEIVNLAQVEFIDDDGPITSLVRGSPCLRELVLFQCIGVTIDFRCLTLKILKLLDCDFSTINIRVPNLEYFELIVDGDTNQHRLEQFVFEDDMPCLSKAKVYACSIRADTWDYVLHKLHHVIKLDVSLSRFIDEQDVALVTKEFKLPYFKRLKCLEISCCEEHALLQTKFLLSHMPNCVSLIIRMKWHCSCADLMKLWPTSKSSRFGEHVEYIEIHGIGKTRLAIVELLRYVLACFKGLKVVKLHLFNWRHSGWKNMMPETIMNLPRPTGCKITIC